MSNKITLATIQFRADTKGVNPALDAMRQSAKDAHKEVDELEKAFANGIKTMQNANGVEFNVADRLRAARKEAKSFDQSIRELIKGATALESVVKNIGMGRIEDSSRAELKGAINGAQSRLRSVRGSDPESLQMQRELNTVIEESRKQLNRLDHDTAKIIETIQQGGSVAQSVLKQEQSGLEEMLTLIPQGTKEWNRYNQQLTTVSEKLREMTIEQQRATGKDTLGRAFRGDFAGADAKTLEQTITKLKEYQSVIDDPRGKGARHFAAAETQIKQLQSTLDQLKGKYTSADEVIQRFNQHLGETKMEHVNTQAQTLAQTLDEKLSQATWQFDGNINDAAKAVDDYERQLREAKEELVKMEAELAALEQKHANSSWLRKRSVAYKREGRRIDDLQEQIEGRVIPAVIGGGTINTGKKAEVEYLEEWKAGAQRNLDTWKKMKAEALGLTEAVEQLNQAELQGEEKKQEARRMTREQMQQGIKVLEDEAFTIDRTTAEGKARYDQLRQTIDQMNEEIKVAANEMMSFADAQALADKAMEEQALTTKTGWAASTEELKRAEQTLAEKVAKAKRGTAEEEAAYQKLVRQLQAVRTELSAGSMSGKQMMDVLSNPKNVTSVDTLKAAIGRARQELDALGRRLDQARQSGQTDEVKKLQKVYDDLAKSVQKTDIRMKELQNSSKGTASAFDKAWSRLKTYVGLYVGAAVAMQKLTAAMGDLLTLSDKMGEVRKTTGFTADEVGRLSGNLAKLDTRTTLTQLMELSSLAGSVGLKTQEQVQGFTEAADQLIVALPELGNESARTIIKIANATGDLEKNNNNVRETLEKVGSTIIALRANSASAAGPITDFVSRVGAVGAQAGISIDQIAALGSTIDALGGRVEMSATALSRMIPAIKNNSFAIANSIGVTEKYLKSLAPMEQMVLIFQKMRDNIQHIDTSTEQGQEQMAQTIEGMLGRNATMREVMKDLEQQGARAGIVFGLLSQNVDELQKQLGIASEAYRENTALANEFNNMNETTAAKWERLKNQVEEMFVRDEAQRTLGNIIDGLRKLADWIAEDGPIVRGLKLIGVYAAAMKMELGATVISAGGAFKNLGIAIGAGFNQLRIFSRATAHARDEWKKMGAAMKANIWGAVIAALAAIAYKLWDIHKAAKEAAAQVGRFNQAVADEQRALNNLFEPLTKSNTVQEERSRLIGELNSKYGKYLGYMLSETNSAIQLADAHALIAKRIREEAYERRIAEQEKAVQDEHSEDLNAAYGKIVSRVRSGIKGGADVTEVADVLKGIVDSRIGEVKYAIDNYDNMFATKYAYELDPKMKAAIDGGIERLVIDGKLSRDNVKLVQQAVIQYTVRAKEQHDDIMKTTANVRSDLRNIQGAIQTDLTNNLNALVGNVIRFSKQQTPTPSPALPPAKQNNPLLNPWGAKSSSGSGNKWGGFPWQRNVKQDNLQMPLPGQLPKVNEKNIDEVRQFVEAQDNLRSYLRQNAENIKDDARATAEAYLVSEKELERLRKLLPAASGGTGSGGQFNNGSNSPTPYGTYNRVTDSYDKWDADSLVARRKEMLERVRALANGAEVQSVLDQDAKFITEATRKNIKDTKQAIEWYNTERLKIQDALHKKHLTNTGDWMDPTKQKARAKVIKDEWSAYLNELDAYYTERKTRIQEAATEEGITEAEMKNRTLANEMEWHQRRAELQKLYAKKSTEVTEEEQQAIFDILSERTGDTADFIQKTIGKTVKFIYDIGQKSEEEQRTIFGKLDKGIERDLLKQQQAVTAQMKAIRDIIEKERPYDGITRNLRENLVTMGILTADMTAERNRLMRENADMSDFNSRQAAEEMKRTAFMLGEAENAYSTTIEEVMRHMGEQGMQAWADAIRGDTQMQQALMAQLRTAYDEIQNAIKKEASLIKKQTDIWWADIAEGQTQSRRDGFEKALSRLGLAEDQVKRANSLIGAGQASERVADRLAIKQMQVRLAMQMTYYNRMRQIGEERIAQLKAEGRLEDAEHLRRSLNLAKTEELKKLEEQRVAIANQMEESQNRLYTALREWGDLVASSIQGVFEASNTGQADFYTEQAKKRLTGASTSGQYIVVENAGTKDAEASYQTLSDQEVLDIEQRNAMADAWKKLMDDLNMKMSETITDQLNAMVQNVSIDANTDALDANTKAILRLAATMAGGGAGDDSAAGAGFGVDGISPLQPTSDTPAAETIISPWQAYAEGSTAAKETILQNQQDIAQGQVQTDTKIQKSTQSAFAKMTVAANLYGIAYQAMSNENMSASQKFGMIAVQAAGNAAITALTTNLSQTTGQVAAETPSVLSKLWSQLGWGAIPVFAIFTGLLGGLMGLAASKIAKSKSEIAQATGVSSVASGRLTTGMLTYADGNVNEFTDPSTLREGRQYNVDAADGRTYRARYMGRNPRTHLTNGPEFHLSGERGREMIIDAGTTRQITMNEGEIWHAIQTLSGGGRISALRRRGRGVSAFADGNLSEFSDYPEYSESAAAGMSAEQAASLQASIDRQSDLLEDLRINGIKATFDVYGKGGLVDSYDSGKKTLNRYGQRY